MMGSTGLSTRTRDERRFKLGIGWLNSEKLAWVESGGRGDLDREVERELAPEREGRVGMCMVLEMRRERVPPQDEPEVGVGCFRVIGASGNRMVEEAGLDPTALEDTEVLSGLSHGALVPLRVTGLSWELDDAAWQK